MPGQRKRKRQQEARHSQPAVLPEGQWQVIFETQDYDAWQSYLRNHRSEFRGFDSARLRMDTLCGRLVQPTTYRLSLFVPEHTSDGLL